ncbi:MAG: L,D-transpeptidase family protein [Clostridiales bacterium]|nr:L,D-transpeptidase family protein [Clostridiales bacterium]
MFLKVSRKLVILALYMLFIFLIYNSMQDLQKENVVETFIKDDEVVKERGLIDEDEYNIMIDITQSALYLFKGDELIKTYTVAHGKAGSPSPVGIWRITNKARNWGSGFGSRWMGLNVPWGRYGIHGTNRPGSIGSMASAGCFRMHNKDVEELYEKVPSGAIVVVSGGPYGNLGSGFVALEPGSRRSHVVEVQKRLKSAGYYDGPIDGIYGEGMKAAVINFRKDKELPASHTVDAQTYEALGIMIFD